MKLTAKQIEKIKTIAREEYPKECVVGITAKGIAIKLENIAADPINDFEVDSKNFIDKGYVALVHSHTIQEVPLAIKGLYVDGRTPSELDIHTQMNLDIPFGILAVDQHEVTDIIWFPNLDADMFTQPYISGVNDCYELVRKYHYQKWGTILPRIAYHVTWWEDNPNLYWQNFAKHGYYEVPLSEIKEGDLVMLKIMGHDKPATHAAVYVGGDEIIHHAANRFAQKDYLSKWSTRMTAVLRHESRK